VRKIKYKKGKKVQPSFLDYTGIHKQTKTEMQLFVFDTDDLTEYKEFNQSQLEKCFELSKINWLNIHGLNDTAVIKAVGDFLHVDNFMLGDILNTTKRTKLDEHQDILFFNIKSLLPIENSDNISVEQVSFLLKKWYFGFVSRKAE
jgi:magnesium transporter